MPEFAPTGLAAFALVAAGGGLGAVARFLLSGTLGRRWQTAGRVPYEVLAVNLIGSLLIGVLAGQGLASGSPMRLALISGFCGGFTTFSTVAVGTVTVAEQADATAKRGAAGYALANLVGCATTAVLGLLLASTV